MNVWLGGTAGPVGQACELFLRLCAKASIVGSAEPVLGEAGISYALQLGDETSPEAGCDALLAATPEALAWARAVRRLVVYDEALGRPQGLRPGAQAIALPGLDWAAAVGALAALAGLERSDLASAWTRRLRRESSDVLAAEVQAAQASCLRVSQALREAWELPRVEGRLICLSGAQALAWGAIAGGCTILTGTESSLGDGASAALKALAEREGVTLCPAADEAAALALAGGAALAGARALADLSSGSLARAADWLECCSRQGLPVVVLAADDGWRWPEELAVAEARPQGVAQACRLAAEAFNKAEGSASPVLVRAGRALLERWESMPELQAGPSIQRRSREAPGSPEVATLEERESLPPEDFLPEGGGGPVSGLLARAWSEQGLQPKDILVVCGDGRQPLPRTCGVRVPAGQAVAFAAGAKAANPGLSVTALDEEGAVFSRGLAQTLASVRCDSGLLTLLLPGAAPPADLLELARAAEPSFLARLPEPPEAAAAVLARALAHKGFALVDCRPGPSGGVLVERAGRPACERERSAPVGRDLSSRPQRLAILSAEAL